MENEIKLNGTVLAESNAAGTEEDPILSLIRAKYMDADGKVHLALLQTLLSSVVDSSGKRLDRILEELQDAVGTGGKPVTEIINAEIDKKVGELNKLETTAKTNVVSAINENFNKFASVYTTRGFRSTDGENAIHINELYHMTDQGMYWIYFTVDRENSDVPDRYTDMNFWALLSVEVGQEGTAKQTMTVYGSNDSFSRTRVNEEWSAYSFLSTDYDSLYRIGLFNKILSDTEWGSIKKTAELPVTFFTAWGAYSELPGQYGSGVIIPGLDSNVKFIHYTIAWNNSTRKWIGTMRFTDETTYTICWEEVPYGKSYIDVTNIDEIIIPGTYVVPSSVSIIPPSSFNWGNESFIWAILIVERVDKYGPWITQTLKITGAKNGVFTLHRMQTNNEGWSEWEQIIDTAVIYGLVSNKNILINSDFKINQRGKTEYTNSYTVDRWRVNTGTLIVNDDHVLISKNNMEYVVLYQIIENGVKLLKGKTVTLSVKINDAVYSKTYNVPSNIDTVFWDSEDLKVDGSNIIRADLYRANNGSFQARVIAATDNVKVSWVKLEYGTVATQFMHPDPAEELVKCKRYYEKSGNITRYKIGDNLFYSNERFAVQKRVNPTVTTYSIAGQAGNVSGWNGSTYTEVETYGTDFITTMGFRVASKEKSLPYMNYDFYYVADAEMY